MRFAGFITYNVLGAVLWIFGLVGSGFYFGEKFPWIVDYVMYIILFFLAITSFTVIKGYFTAKKDMND